MNYIPTTFHTQIHKAMYENPYNIILFNIDRYKIQIDIKYTGCP